MSVFRLDELIFLVQARRCEDPYAYITICRPLDDIEAENVARSKAQQWSKAEIKKMNTHGNKTSCICKCRISVHIRDEYAEACPRYETRVRKPRPSMGRHGRGTAETI